MGHTALEQDKGHLFRNRDLWKLLVPLVIEQFLASLMGIIDAMMVSNIGSAAISAVSLVDSINVLVIQAFSALAAGGTILCSQFIGSGDEKGAKRAAEQVVFLVAAVSVFITAFCLLFRTGLLRLVFGAVEPAIMEASETYFFYTSLSFPFIALYGAGSSILRAQADSKRPMLISVVSNCLNVGGNAVLIWGFHMGVAGAAVSTLVSRIFCALTVYAVLRRQDRKIVIRDYWKIRPTWALIRKVLSIGIPSGIENSMFQFGKLAIQSTVSTLGTVAIAAQAMTNILEGLSGVTAMGIGIGLMTVVGQCIGAGREDEAVYYIKKLSLAAEAVVTVSCLVVFALTKPVTVLGGMEAESAAMCFTMMAVITVVKPLAWTMCFIPADGMRAAGDVRFTMVVSCVSMWLCRVSLSMFLCRVMGFGPMGVWIGMFADWTVRGLAFGLRFRSRKWLAAGVLVDRGNT